MYFQYRLPTRENGGGRGLKMQVRDVVAVLDGFDARDAVLAAAIDIAERFDAHLSGLCPIDLLTPTDFGPTLKRDPGGLVALAETALHLETAAREEAASIEASFRERISRRGVRGDWQLASGESTQTIIHRARTADLLVLGQPHPERPSAAAAQRLIEDTLMTTGRPQLIIPFVGWTEKIATNVLLGWNGTREAARAAHDALLLIAPGARLTIFTIVPPRAALTSEVPGAQIAAHMARHGMDVSVTRTVSGDDVSDGNLLLNCAADIGADLLVVGGYGHSRTRELVLGGVTRGLLAHMTLPVLMSH